MIGKASHRWYYHNWIYDPSFSMPVLMESTWHDLCALSWHLPTAIQSLFWLVQCFQLFAKGVSLLHFLFCSERSCVALINWFLFTDLPGMFNWLLFSSIILSFGICMIVLCFLDKTVLVIIAELERDIVDKNWTIEKDNKLEFQYYETELLGNDSFVVY